MSYFRCVVARVLPRSPPTRVLTALAANALLTTLAADALRQGLLF
jgi:hypothetical protein